LALDESRPLHWMLRSALPYGVPVDKNKVFQDCGKAQAGLPDLDSQGGSRETAIPKTVSSDVLVLHSSVTVCTDTDGRCHNNASTGLNVLDDDWKFIAKFGAAGAAG
jgi:hypothetical protein